jgi:hypothetical protein
MLVRTNIYLCISHLGTKPIHRASCFGTPSIEERLGLINDRKKEEGHGRNRMQLRVNRMQLRVNRMQLRVNRMQLRVNRMQLRVNRMQLRVNRVALLVQLKRA